MPQHYSLFELNKFIRQAIALNFEESVWIHAEIAQISFSGRHAYLDLWQKDEDTDEVLARAGAAIWASKLGFIKRKMGAMAQQILAPGIDILIKVKPEFHEKYGLKLVILDLDPTYTLGQLALEREQTIALLAERKLIDRNSMLPLPSVLQRIAVLSSETSAGYQDFIEQLKHNEWGYAYQMDFYPIAVQGRNVVSELVDQMDTIEDSGITYDCIAIMRGGGSKMDLAVFDKYEICERIALSSFPVLSAIGHERDESVLDIVSAINVKTPTAAAEYLIAHNLNYEQSLLDYFHDIQQIISSTIDSEKSRLVSSRVAIKNYSNYTLEKERQFLNYEKKRLSFLLTKTMESEAHLLESIKMQIKDKDPKTILKRGYSMTLHDGNIVRDASELGKGDVIKTVFADSETKSQIL